MTNGMASSPNTPGVTSFTDSVPLSWSYPCPCEGQIVVTMESRDRPTEVSVVLHIQHRGGYPTSRCQHFAKGVQAEEMRRLQALMDQTRKQVMAETAVPSCGEHGCTVKGAHNHFTNLTFTSPATQPDSVQRFPLPPRSIA